MFIFRFLLCCCVLSVSATGAMAQKLQFSYTNGQTVSAEVTAESLTWTRVFDSGESETQVVPLSSIKQLVLTKSPATHQIAEIRRLIEQLDSSSFQERENAEKKLSDPKVTAGYYDLILQRSDDPRLEVQFRLGRILDKIVEHRVQSKLLFDTLVLKNGTTMEGEAGDFTWDGKFLGRVIKIRRSELTSIRHITNDSANATPKDGTVSVKLFHKHETFAADKSLRVVDFLSDPNGNRLSSREDVTNTFVPWGLKFDDSGKGYVGIPSYTLKRKLGSLPVENPMIAYYNRKPGRRGIPFKGQIDFQFCAPNQPETPAGVYRFGTFIATVDSPRSFILEAFDWQGDLIGTVEAKKAYCGFLGIESTALIHRIQIRSNPYLYRVDDNVDDDYGLDTFYFTKPVPTTLPVNHAINGVVLRDGTRLIGTVALNAGKVSIASNGLGQIEVSLDRVAQIGFGKLAAKRLKTWMATLDDGSTVAVDPLRQFQSSLLKRSTKNELRCLYKSSTPKRLPVDGDFEQGKAVLVYPTCRIPIATVDFKENGFGWSPNAKKLLQPVDKESPLGIPGKDPTPLVSEIDYKKTTAENLPTLWLGQPQAMTRGFVRLVDGQTLSLGDHRKITSMSTSSLQLSEPGSSGSKLSIPIDQVAAISFGR